MMYPISAQEDRLLRTLALGFDAAATLALSHLYVRQERPATAWRLLERLEATHGPALLAPLKADLTTHGGLIILPKIEHDAALSRIRGSGGVAALPRNERKRASVFYFIWSSLDLDARYTPEQLNRTLYGALGTLQLTCDHCHLRRYMLSARALRRTIDGSTYWANPESPIIVTPARPMTKK